MGDMSDLQRAIGPLRVQRRQCDTCIYRPDTHFDLAQLEAEVRDEHMGFKGYRICHHSDDACCRGFWNRHKDEFPAGQIAQRLELVSFVDDDTLPTDTDTDE